MSLDSHRFTIKQYIILVKLPSYTTSDRDVREQINVSASPAISQSDVCCYPWLILPSARRF